MAGLHIQIELAEQGAIHALNRLLEAGQRPRPALIQIGEHLIESHERRFAEQKDPQGQPWAPLSRAYLESERKKRSRGPDLILVLNRYLASTFRYTAGEDELLFGTDRIYGAAQQFGVPARNIPARPFLGISSGDGASISDIVSDFLKRSFNGS